MTAMKHVDNAQFAAMEAEELLKLYKERRLSDLEKELLHILLHGMLGHFEMWSDVSRQELFDFCADIEVERLMKRLKPEYGKQKPADRNEQPVGFRRLYAQHLKRLNSGKLNPEKIKQSSSSEGRDDHQFWKKKEKMDKMKFYIFNNKSERKVMSLRSRQKEKIWKKRNRKSLEFQRNFAKIGKFWKISEILPTYSLDKN